MSDVKGKVEDGIESLKQGAVHAGNKAEEATEKVADKAKEASNGRRQQGEGSGRQDQGRRPLSRGVDRRTPEAKGPGRLTGRPGPRFVSKGSGLAREGLDPDVAELDGVAVVLEHDRAGLALLHAADAAGGGGDLACSSDDLQAVLDDGEAGLLDDLRRPHAWRRGR